MTKARSDLLYKLLSVVTRGAGKIIIYAVYSVLYTAYCIQIVQGAVAAAAAAAAATKATRRAKDLECIKRPPGIATKTWHKRATYNKE